MDSDTETPKEIKCCLCDEMFDTSEQSPQLPTGWRNAICLDCRLGSLSDSGESKVKALLKPHANIPESPSFKAKRSQRGRPDSAILCAECETKPAVIKCTVCDETPYCQVCFDENYRSRTQRGHAFRPLGSKTTTSVKHLMCPVHPEHQVTLFCPIDKQLVCLVCTVLTHSDHEVIDTAAYHDSCQESSQGGLTIKVLATRSSKCCYQHNILTTNDLSFNKRSNLFELTSTNIWTRSALDWTKRCSPNALDFTSNSKNSSLTILVSVFMRNKYMHCSSAKIMRVLSMRAKSSVLHFKSFEVQNCPCVLCRRPT